MSPEEYTADLARRIAPEIAKLFGEDRPALVEMAVYRTLTTISNDVRQGRTARLECLGRIKRDGDWVRYVPDDILQIDLPKEDAA